MNQQVYTRKAFFRGLWAQGLVGQGLAALWFLYGLLAAIRDDLLPVSTREKYTVAALLAHALAIPFAWWLVVALGIIIGWLFEAAFRETKGGNSEIATLELRLENRDKRQAAIDELWKLRASGIELRNRNVSSAQFPNWSVEWHQWRDEVWNKANDVNPNLRHWLEYLDQCREPPKRALPYCNQDHQRLVTSSSEMLQRLQEFLEKEIR